MTDDETAFMKGFKRGELQVQATSTFLVEGNNSPHMYTVLSGWGQADSQFRFTGRSGRPAGHPFGRNAALGRSTVGYDAVCL